jgi:phosphoribosylamine--glycine ligase
MVDKRTAQKLMIIGGGGREHALAWKLAKSPDVDSIVCVPGNGGTATTAKVENIALAISDFSAIADLAIAKKTDLIVVGPDNPLADGIVDYLEGRSLTVFGPTKEQAKLEWSKSHAKAVMKELGLPTARFHTSRDLTEALAFVNDPKNAWARVIKADGLALGKGVFVCDTTAECEDALTSIFGGTFGEAGKIVVMEDRLEGEELSLLCVSDGKTLLELGCAQDHKRRFAEDKGPNTGGMGAYSPVPLYENAEVAQRIKRDILRPIEDALRSGRLSFKGVLFIGLMIVSGAPYILEFNARLGDPETQAILARLNSDLLPVLMACTGNSLQGVELDWSPLKSVCVTVVTKEYPVKSSSGEKIAIESNQADDRDPDQDPAKDPDQDRHKYTGNARADTAIIFHAGTKIEKDTSGSSSLVTAGGRVFSVVGLGTTMETARHAAHGAIGKIHFATLDFRSDIGWRALKQCVSK